LSQRWEKIKKVKQATTENVAIFIMKIIILAIVPCTAFSHFVLSTCTYILIRLMRSSTYFKCRKDFNKIVPES